MRPVPAGAGTPGAGRISSPCPSLARRRIAALAALLAARLLIATPAASSEPGPRPSDAARRLIEQAKARPEEPAAARLLLQAGQMCMRVSFDFDSGEEALALLVERYPRAKEARLGRDLLEELRSGRAAGEAAFRTVLAVKHGAFPGGIREKIDAMEGVLRDSPSAPYLPGVHLWLAIESRRLGRFDSALGHLNALSDGWPLCPEAEQAVWEIGQTYFEQGHFEIARQWFSRVESLPGQTPKAKMQAAWDVRRMEKHIVRRKLLWIALPLASAWVAFLLARTRVRSVSLPMVRQSVRDLLFVLPVYLALGVALRHYSPPIRDSALLVALGTAVLLFVSNLHLLTSIVPRWERVLYVPVTLLVFAALTYSILYRNDLVFLIEDTIRFGPEPA